MAAEVIAATGAHVEIMTPDRAFAPEVMGMNLAPYMRALQHRDVRFTVTYRLLAAARDGNRLRATIGTDYSAHTEERHFDQIVVNHGTLPLDDLYHALRPLSGNKGRGRLRGPLDGPPPAPPASGFNCSASATPSSPATPMLRSTTRSA